jgi:DNA-binding Xre family transcriptional regulator
MKTNKFRVLLANKEVEECRTISLRDVARETGVSIYTVSGFANSTLKALPVEALDAFCEYFGCTPNDLLTVEHPKKGESTGNVVPVLAAA